MAVEAVDVGPTPSKQKVQMNLPFVEGAGDAEGLHRLSKDGLPPESAGLLEP